MTSGTRAVLYIVRKWKRTLLLFCLLLAITTLALSGLAISDAQETQAEALRGTTGAGFTVSRNLDAGEWVSDGQGNYYNVQDYLSDRMIETIAGIDGIAAYNASMVGLEYCYTADGGIIDLVDWGEYEAFMGVSEVDCISYMYGCVNSEYHNLFTSGKFVMAEGSPITPDSDHQIVMSRQAASDNGLAIGDTIIIRDDEETAIEATLTGLFDIVADEQDFDMNNESSYFGYMAYSFLDLGSMKELLAHYYENGAECDAADFFVSDPEKLESILADVRSIDSISWDNYTITVNNEVYLRVSGSISDTGALMKTLIAIATFVSVILVVLLLSMAVRSRKRETGILLSIGISKISILSQYVMETLLTAIAAFPLAYLSSRRLAGTLGLLFGRTAENIAVTSQHLLTVGAVGGVLLVLAVGLSCLPVMRYRPREILSQME